MKTLWISNLLSLCDEFKSSSGFQKGFCGENAFKKPDWLEKTDETDGGIISHVVGVADGAETGQDLIDIFKNSGWYSYD